MKHSERAPIYEVVQSEVSIEEAGQCTTYGIACVFKDSTAGKSQAITIADISSTGPLWRTQPASSIGSRFRLTVFGAP